MTGLVDHEALKTGPHKSKRDARDHAVGNTFHVPSIVILLSLLVCPTAARVPGHLTYTPPTANERREWEDAYVPGSTWERKETEHEFCKPSAQVWKEAIELFPEGFFASVSVEVEKSRIEFEKLDLKVFFRFQRYLKEKGAPESLTGPDIQALWSKAPMHAAVGKQHRPSVSG